MTRTLTIAAMLLAIPGLAGAQQTPAATAAPTKAIDSQAAAAKATIDIVEKIKDFGQVAKGEKLKAVFEVRNTGTAPLEISSVRPTCGCTVANFDKTVAPGATGKIEAEVDTTAFSGPIAKSVLVFSNDPANPQVNLVIKAEVRSFVEVLPRNLIRLNVLQGEPATEKVTLSSADGTDFKVTGVDTGGGPYEVTYRELPEKERIPERKGSQWEVSVTVPANAPEGLLNHKLIVKTTAPKAAEVTLQTSGMVRPIVQVIPGEINFGTLSSDAPVGRNVILINNRQGTQLELPKLEIDNSQFSYEVIPLQAGQRYQVAVTMAAGTPKGVQKATLKITTNDAARKLIEIPIQATVQ
jgi:hypothetical protein